MKAYLDIETSFEGAITVVGLYATDRGLIQLVDPHISDVTVWQALEGVETICTYNGSRFDLPMIRRRLSLDLCAAFQSHDLMYTCWRHGLFGGLKRVEEQLGIPRRSKGIDGMEAMRLWSRYEDGGDKEALQVLLTYNREDVLNLPLLEARLMEIEGTYARRD
ncbi:exonuclease [Candidatus Methylomirabilis lanthanidiphila]|uniref:Exonuclease n=1 Tax=Candidatus Methylomirabilis lanthanidiphila TaxID=2211376 RepID=A0A564ZI99_9BACT|nr:ribonuclease H-like domain-containing protein [Candidatus Methylomirabilis lanthanidiphila]VUZ85059.1 exonuclease [Candidatus Methylomirabilis lanthanidiphila]